MHRRKTTVGSSHWTQKERLLKTCRHCRTNKTLCDALQKSPDPCTYCTKKNLSCKLDVAKPANRDYDNSGEIVRRVQEMHRQLDLVVARKEHLIKRLVEKQIKTTGQISSFVPTIDELQTALFSPKLSPELEKMFIDPIPTRSHADSFTIHSNLMSSPFTVSLERAEDLFQRFRDEYSNFLPVLPESFFASSLHDVYKDSDLLFWTIIVTAFITHGSNEDYHLLSAHVQNLVVVNCWFKTPRSLYSLVALLILTLWPLPNKTLYNIQDSIAIKYASLMKSLALQFGLHKLNFIEEFSKKTNVDIDASKDINNTMRERIYKYVNINSNYWLVFLGLSNSNYNGLHQDYIINKAANFDLFKKGEFSETDNFINSLLKISLIQLKMNESMSDFLANPDKIGKMIHLNMFEQILSGYMNSSSPLYNHDLIDLSLEFSKLQLFVYYLSESDINLSEYKKVIGRAVQCCGSIIELFEKSFGSGKQLQLIPIHYRFSIELATLVLLQIYYSPLLSSVEAYQNTKRLFLRAYAIVTDLQSQKNYSRVLQMCVDKVVNSDCTQFWAEKSIAKNLFLVNKMAKYLVSASYYEMLWMVYKSDHLIQANIEMDWTPFGLNPELENDRQVIRFFLKSESVFD